MGSLVVSVHLLFVLLLLFALALFLEGLWIAWLHRIKAAQVLKAYGPQRHLEAKRGTPTMGGVLFPVTFCIGCLLACPLMEIRTGELGLFLLFPLAVTAIGLLDDVIKFRRHSSEGLRSLQKLAFQILVCLPWAFWISFDRGLYLWPGMALPGGVAVPLLLFLSLGAVNAVNITDGLDGLASGAFALSMVAGALLFGGPWRVICLLAATLSLAFLWHNGHPAKVFMGDVGAHFLGGLLIALCVHAQWTLALFPLGFLFGVEALSVVIQLTSLRTRGKKIFLMSPIHHHFELLGWKETEIVLRFWIIHILGMAFLFTFVLGWVR